MELLLERSLKGDICTIGSLFIDDQFECYSLEDKVRQVYGVPVEKWKIQNQTAIPTGRYEVIISLSARFGFNTPLLLNVPGYTGIRIHKGNYAGDTDGCILVGEDKLEDKNMITSSELAFEALMAKLVPVLGKGEKVYITVG